MRSWIDIMDNSHFLFEGFFAGDDDCWIDTEGQYHDLDRGHRQTHRQMAEELFKNELSPGDDAVKHACARGWIRLWVEGQICFIQLDFKKASRKAIRSCADFLRKSIGVTKVGIENSTSTDYEELNLRAAVTRLIQMSIKQDLSAMFEAEQVEETYSRENQYLIGDLAAPFDGYRYWHLAYTWMQQTGQEDEVLEALGEYPQEDENEQFEKLTDELKESFEEWVYEYLNRHDPAELPSSYYLTPDKKLLPRTTWLVHFTNEPDAIASEGFTHGTFDSSQLGLTTYFSKDSKRYGGYNFAFVAGSRYAKWAAAKGKYGRHCVVFQNSGVKSWHMSDEEDQVIFWGPQVDHRHIAVLIHDDGEWKVVSRTGMTLFSGDFEVAVEWVKANHRQYSRQLYR